MSERTDAGTTLVELLIAMSIMAVVATVALQFTSSLGAAANRNDTLAANSEAVRLAAAQVARDVRSANPLVANDTYTDAATGLSVTRTVSSSEVIMAASSLTATAQMVDWRFDATSHSLKRCVRPTTSPATYSCSAVLSGVNTSSAIPMFRYFCVSGAQLDPASANGPLDIAQAANRVRISLDAAPLGGPVPLPVQVDAEIRDFPRGAGC